DFILSTPATEVQQMRIELLCFACACGRYGISDKAAAALVSAVLQDVGLLSADNLSMVIYRNKVRRERIRTRTDLQNNVPAIALRGLYFDGRKDKTNVVIKKGEKSYRTTVIEEPISLVQEPANDYLGVRG